MTLRWGLIGASDIASTRFVPSARAVGHDLAAVFSASPVRAAAFADANGITVTARTLDELLQRSDVDAVYISTRNPLHRDQAVAAAAAGKHILCEKPLALTLEDAVHMVDSAKSSGVVFGTNHHLPCAGTHRAIRALIGDGVIGSPRSIRVSFAAMLPDRLQGWRVSDPHSGGVILDLATHNTAVVHMMLPGRALAVQTISCRQGGWESAVEDASMSLIDYERDVLVQTYESYTTSFASMSLEVHGSDGSIYGADIMRQNPVGTIRLRDARGEREVPVDDRRDLYQIGLLEFAGAVAGHGEPAVSGRDGIRSLAVALAARESASTGRRVVIPDLT